MRLGRDFMRNKNKLGIEWGDNNSRCKPEMQGV